MCDALAPLVTSRHDSGGAGAGVTGTRTNHWHHLALMSAGSG